MALPCFKSFPGDIPPAPACPANGWKQQRNDCWIDSAFYVMFASDTLRSEFRNTLIQANSSGHSSLRLFAKLTYNYLLGLGYDAYWQSTCKQSLKRDIGKTIINYAKVLQAKGNDRLEGFIYADEVGQFIDAAGNGNSSLLLQFISAFDTNIYYDIETPNTFNASCRGTTGTGASRKPIMDFIKQRIDSINTKGSSAKVLVIPFTSIDSYKCKNVSRLTELTSYAGWSLEALIKGNAVHYTADVKCSGKWYSYDDQGISTTRAIANDDWTNKDSVVFLFKKVSVPGGGRKSRRFSTRSNRKSRHRNRTMKYRY